MNVRSLIFARNNRHVHEAVYRPASTRECDSLVKDPDSWPYRHITMSLGNPYMAQSAARIVFIHYRKQALLAAMVNLFDDKPMFAPAQVELLDAVEVSATLPKALTDKQRNACRTLLLNMYYCAPNQGFSSDWGRDLSCDQYRLCPWCRYRKALQLFDTLSALLKKDREVCVTHFLSPCKPDQLDLNSSEAAYERVARSVRDQRDWIGDYLITLPGQVRSLDGQYRLVWRTSLIAVVPKGRVMQVPESMAPKQVKDANFMSDGVVYRYPADSKGLSMAFAPVLGYPKWMLSAKLTDELLNIILTVLLAGDRNRAVPHGIEFEAATEPPAVQTASAEPPASQ